MMSLPRRAAALTLPHIMTSPHFSFTQGVRLPWKHVASIRPPSSLASTGSVGEIFCRPRKPFSNLSARLCAPPPPLLPFDVLFASGWVLHLLLLISERLEFRKGGWYRKPPEMCFAVVLTPAVFSRRFILHPSILFTSIHGL